MNGVEAVFHNAAYAIDYGKKDDFFKFNIQGTRTPRWGIAGILRSRRKPTNAGKKFKSGVTDFRNNRQGSSLFEFN